LTWSLKQLNVFLLCFKASRLVEGEALVPQESHRFFNRLANNDAFREAIEMTKRSTGGVDSSATTTLRMQTLDSALRDSTTTLGSEIAIEIEAGNSAAAAGSFSSSVGVSGFGDPNEMMMRKKEKKVTTTATADGIEMIEQRLFALH